MKAYLTISHGSTTLGTLRLTLRPDIVPKTVENFVHFLTTSKDSADGDSSEKNAGYKNSTFHRIIPTFMAQGGDFLNHDGTGSTSLYGPSFPDENFLLSHSQRGTLSMANSGADTNGCQFFITFKATAHLDGKHVVFGYVDWRDDEESARVLDSLERVQTNRRRGDRPLETVRIVDCGIVDDGKKYKVGKDKKGELGRMSAEEKKTKLMQAYGDVNPAADDDEIDLDEDEEEEDDESPTPSAVTKEATKQTINNDEIDLDQDETNDRDGLNQSADEKELESSPPLSTGKISSKKAALQKRLAALRKKMNQSRTLNRREVHAEAARLGTDEASAKERKRLSKEDRNAKKKEFDTYVVGKLRSVGEGTGLTDDEKKLASLSQPAYESIRKMNAKAEKKENSQHGPDDYYNPEGQHSNYQRNLKSIRHNNYIQGAAATDSYDPTTAAYSNINNPSATKNERDGAKRLANEMKRRAEKRANAKRKPEFEAYDVSYINDRNKRFNEKISRNFDEHTAEIRQNLERGTAL